MEDPTFWNNQEAAQATIAALKPLNGLIKPFEELNVAIGDLEALVELTEEDESLEGELEAELNKVSASVESLELRSMLSGKQDAANALLRIQAGAGGTDACDWAAMLQRMYIRWAERNGFSAEIIDEEPNIEAGIQSTELRISGDYAYGYLQGETGVHRLVRISPFGSGDTRQTSFAAVDVLPEINETIEIEINPGDLEVQTFTSGGPGGQHQNKTQSGVRLIHKPTNVRAESRAGRSQHQNRDHAMQLLKARLYAIEEAKRLGDTEKRYDEKGEVAFGSQIRNYVLQPYRLAKDLRTGEETPQVDLVLDGDIERFLQAFLRYKVEREHKHKAKK